MSRDKKDIKEAINQLESLRFHCEQMSNAGESEEWKRDTKALDLAIEVLKREKIEVVKVNRSYKQIVCNDQDIDEYKRFAKRMAVTMLKLEILKKGLLNITYLERDKGFKEIEVIAELDVVKREV